MDQFKKNQKYVHFNENSTVRYFDKNSPSVCYFHYGDCIEVPTQIITSKSQNHQKRVGPILYRIGVELTFQNNKTVEITHENQHLYYHHIGMNYEDLSNRDLRWKNLDYADLRNAIIFGSALNYISAIEADFTKSVLIESDFYKGNLQRSIFDKANLSYTMCINADFRDSSFKESILRQTNFRNSKLCDVDFSLSEFDGANLTGTNLHNALFNTNPYYAGVGDRIVFNDYHTHENQYKKTLDNENFIHNNPVNDVMTWDGNIKDSYEKLSKL